jgi:hypothetical protein
MVGNLTFAWGLTQINPQVSSSWILEPQSTQSQVGMGAWENQNVKTQTNMNVYMS